VVSILTTITFEKIMGDAMRMLQSIIFSLLISSILICAQVNESFEEVDFPPVGWSISKDAGTTDWTRATTSPNTGVAHANSTNPAAGANKTLTVNVNFTEDASSVSYYVAVTSISSGTGATLQISGSVDGLVWTLLRSIDLEDAGTFSANTYVQFTDFIDGTINVSGNSLDLRGDSDAYIRWVHNKSSATAASCRLDDVTMDAATALPVELTSFEGKYANNSVQLNWETATETNNAGFQVQRQNSEPGNQNLEWEVLDFIVGHGTTNSPKYYSYMDEDLPNADKLYYRLKQIDNDGTYAYSKTVEIDLSDVTSVDEENIQYDFALKQNYPNPFNPVTTINFTLPNVGTTHELSLQAKLTVYNLLGQEVRTLFNEVKPAGSYQVQFDASDLPSGIYFYTLTYGNNIHTRKLALLK